MFLTHFYVLHRLLIVLFLVFHKSCMYRWIWPTILSFGMSGGVPNDSHENTIPVIPLLPSF